MLINALNRLLCNTNAVFLSIQGKGLKLLTEKERFIALCEEIHRDGIGELMNWLESSDFYTAPASTRYHGSRPGGLVTHSINVYEELKRSGLGYTMEWRELCAADYGVHTTRTRFFGVFRCDGKPIVWPKQTHGKRGTKDVENGTLEAWKPAYEILDFNIIAPSIFATKEEIKQKYSVRAVRPLKDNTLRRVARGLDKFILQSDEPFAVKLQQGQAATVAPYLVQYHTERSEHVRGQCVDEPIMTLDASNRYGVVCPILTKYYGNDEHGQDIRDPLHTVTAKDREGVILVHTKQVENLRPMRYLSDTMMVTSIGSVDKYGRWPCVREILNRWAGYTIKEDELLLKKICGEWYFIEDIGLRMLKTKEAYRAMGFAPDYVFNVDSDGQKITASKQMEKCGNAVCPDIAGLIAASNLPEYARTTVCRSMEEWRKSVVA